MKHLAFILIVFCQSCINQNANDTNQTDKPTTVDSGYKTEEGVKTYVPSKDKEQKSISQKDVIMNEEMVEMVNETEQRNLPL